MRSAGDYGVAQPWHFPCSKLYFRFVRPRAVQPAEAVAQDLPVNLSLAPAAEQKGEAPEPRPGSSTILQVNNLRKVFDNGTVAVADVSLRAQRDTILVMLGHNGAGKTTMISMLSGLIPPTAGDAFVKGMSIKTQLEV